DSLPPGGFPMVSISPQAVESHKSKRLVVGNGAIVRFEQAWISQGLALGSLLHSVALAPGEQTNIAIIDWSRQDVSRRAEQTAGQETLVASIEHTRSLFEVANAVARESQSGFSQSENSSNARSQSESSGWGTGSGGAGGFAPYFAGVAGA